MEDERRKREQDSEFDRFYLLKKIGDITRSLFQDLVSVRLPTLYIDKFSTFCIEASGYCCCRSDLPKGKEILTMERGSQARRLDVLLRVLLIVQQLLQQNKHGSKRDIYYMHPSVFREQSVVDRAINDICILLRCSRHNLNVVSVGNGLVMGWLRFTEAGRKFDCINCPNMGAPVHVEDVEDMISLAEYILIVEKESVFQRLADDQFCKHNRCIVITGRGYPDVPTRRFLRLLAKTLHLPIYCLVDCDPYGIDILTTFRFGSMQMAYDAKSLRLPEIRWLGAFPSDYKHKLRGMLHRCYMEREVPYWRELFAIQNPKGSIHLSSWLCFLSFHSTIRLNEKNCVLKVNVHCQACKMKMLEVLGSICGVYDVNIDSQEGLAKVYGVVNPNRLVRALTRTGYHAELKWVNLRHPELNRLRYHSHGYNYDRGYYGNGYPHRVLGDPHRCGRWLTDYSYPCSSRFDHLYHHGPPVRYVPSYPPKEYDPYEDEPISFCTIM